MSRLLALLLAAPFVFAAASCEGRMVAENPGVLRGTLVSEGNRPLPEVMVFLVRRGILHYSDHTVTRSDGSFSFGNVPAGDYVVAYGAQLRQGSRVTVKEGEGTSLRCEFKSDGAVLLSGRVTVSGAPATGGLVDFTRLDPEPARLVWPPPVEEAQIGATGSYELRIVPGRYLVRFREKRDTPTQYVRLVVMEPEQKQLDLSIPDRALEGTITGPSGRPVRGAMLFLSPCEIQTGWVPFMMSAQAETDKAGAFVFPHVDPGPYDLVVAQTDWSEDEPGIGIQLWPCIEVAKEKKYIVVQVNGPFLIDVKLGIASGTGDFPYAIVISKNHPKLRTILKHRVSPEGFPVLGPPTLFPAGKYFVFAMADLGDYACEASMVDVPDKENVSFHLVSPGAVKVILNGKPADVAGRTVKLWDEAGKLVPRLYDPLWSYDPDLVPVVVLPTAPDGITTIWRVRPGQYNLTVDGTKAKGRVEVRAGETAIASVNLDE